MLYSKELLMRNRYDEKGNFKSSHAMTFDEILDDYEIKTILNDKFVDLSYVGFVKELQDNKVDDIFNDKKYVSSEILNHMAFDYIKSAELLAKFVLNDRNSNTGKELIVSNYTIPAAYLCKHSIELKIKECLLEKNEANANTHNLQTLWDKLNEKSITNYEKLSLFIKEMNDIDFNDESLRYGVDKDFNTVTTTFKIDVVQAVLNTKYLFNVLDEEVIHKYRYRRKED